jgi:hypothetical protein
MRFCVVLLAFASAVFAAPLAEAEPYSSLYWDSVLTIREPVPTPPSGWNDGW